LCNFNGNPIYAVYRDKSTTVLKQTPESPQQSAAINGIPMSAVNPVNADHSTNKTKEKKTATCPKCQIKLSYTASKRNVLIKCTKCLNSFSPHTHLS